MPFVCDLLMLLQVVCGDQEKRSFVVEYCLMANKCRAVRRQKAGLGGDRNHQIPQVHPKRCTAGQQTFGTA